MLHEDVIKKNKNVTGKNIFKKNFPQKCDFATFRFNIQAFREPREISVLPKK
jgi:hypothetical protein